MTRFLLFFLCTFSFIAHSQTVGWFYSNPGAANGYVLFAPGSSDTTYLIDKCGKQIHKWASTYSPGLAVYLLNDGTILRCGDIGNTQFQAGGQGGIIEMIDWNSNITWSYAISDNSQCQHHDAIQLPNGNIVAIVWDSHTKADAQNNGRVTLGNKMWSEKIVEIQPVGADSGIIVWEWRAWDHLVQDVDSTKLNFGVVADHPELLNINLGTLTSTYSDWLHFNGLYYNPALDQLMVSCHELSEVYIIDHSTTTEEAASHTGGNSGRGGDLLYRWGNPQNYGRGTADDQKLFKQHHSQWISAEGQILVFNNGMGRPGDDYSTVEVFTLPAMSGNNYPIEADSPYQPIAQDWIYAADPPISLYSNVQGGAQRMPNGNTLICNGTSGEFLEIDPLGNNVWKYVNPVDKNHILEQGEEPFFNDCFRATYLPSNYAAFAGQTLTPGPPIEINPLSYECENFPTAVIDIEREDEGITIYPNPFRKSFNIYVPVELEHGVLQIHDVTGRILYEDKNFTSSPQSGHVISLDILPGIMFISMKDEEGNYIWNTTAVAQ